MIDAELLVPQMIRARAASSDGIFLQHVDGETLTYGQLHEANLRWADAYRRLGVKARDNVATMLPGSFASYSTWLGLSWLGAVEVPINTGFKGRMLRYLTDNSQCKLMVVANEFLPRVAQLANQLPRLETVVVADGAPNLDNLPFRTIGIDEFLAEATPDYALLGPAWDDIACIIYTSGTTGPSKGVLIPWSAFYYNNFGMPEDALEPGGGYYSYWPPFHMSGKLALTLPLFKGARLVFREVFSVTNFWDDVKLFNCTVAVLVGPMSRMLLAVPERDDDACNPLRGATIGPLYPEVTDFMRRFDVKVSSGFGMTEAGGPIVTSGWDVANWTSCGKVRQGPPGYEVRVVDEHDRDLPPNTPGELILRTEEPGSITPGYFDMPAETARAWRGGWFHTGDCFRYDEDGYYYFVDRMTDSIRRRGENISSFEVEAHINDHPAVLESAAVPVPSEFGEDEVKAYVVLQPGATLSAEDLIEYLVPNMARFMIPRYVEFASALPRTDATGRIKKYLLRQDPLNDQTWDRERSGVTLPR